MSSVFAVSVLAQQSPGVAQFLPLLLIVAVFYLLIIRPQQRKVRSHQTLVKSVDVADRVVTVGGIHGTVTEIDDETMRLEVAPGVVITMARSAIGTRLVDADTGVDDEVDLTDPPSGATDSPSL